MTLSLIIAIATALSMTGAVLIKPYISIGKAKLGLYWIICLIGAILMLAFNCVDFSFVISGITADTAVNPLKILTLFICMTLLSIFLGDAGFFDYVADKIFIKCRGGQFKLFVILYAVVSILTVFTSNDIIILTFTPPICIFAKRAKISPLPFLFCEFIGANTWSMMLIVGNPTNVYLAQSAGISFMEYVSVMFAPAIAGGLVGFLMLVLIFRKQLLSPVSRDNNLTEKRYVAPLVKVPMAVTATHLLACIILLAVSDVIGVEMWIICLVLTVTLSIFTAIYNLLVVGSLRPLFNSLKKAPFELVPFVISMFIIVLALKQNGVTDVVGSLIVSGHNSDGVSFGFLSAISANLLNNIPMSVLFEKIISGTSLSAVYGAVIGSNVGAFITPVGALAGIMWSKILSKHQIKMPFYKFFLYGSAVAIPILVASSVCLILVI